jgi:hypothetical protein
MKQKPTAAELIDRLKEHRRQVAAKASEEPAILYASDPSLGGDEDARRDQESEAGNRQASLKFESYRFVTTLLEKHPDVTVKEATAAVRFVFPSRRGPSAHSMGRRERQIMKKAVAAVQREHKDWGKRGAYEFVAQEIGLQPETVRKLAR